MRLLELLASRKSLVRSYFYSVNLMLLFKVGAILAKTNDVCIINEHKIRWNLAPVLEFNPRCVEGAKLLVFEAESELEVPQEFWLATSPKRLKLQADVVEVVKLSDGSFKATLANELFNFRISGGQLLELKMGSDEAEVLRLLEEWGGEAELKDVVAVASKRCGMTRDAVREVVWRLKEKGYLDLIGRLVKKKNMREG
ncbi:hypothetical protein HS1genome_2376 [Sulfodiicoccus acidiphilus]|uniref:Uncharacterized protein n=1 Tax=Sulfodiicoccus acidiphilus TaxID=1670455 RepID=A0A348B735_9CREN|nr:hypothetical protein [Sulfodiicoccus acidiphilus]BBD73987.1 hypothetical protein HS1genome_2376 [Sulfodiicoccus acidiphilus]GGU02638.1 hypothetical protein GCM10007116_19590 [Sulfodiicoccus acidiphilus]